MTNSKPSEKCLKCTKQFSSSRQKSLTCTTCFSSLHLKCTHIAKNDFTVYKKGEKNFVCQYCMDFRCMSCNKHVYDKQQGIYCDGCCVWIHRKCAKINKNEYDKLCQSDDPWFCRNCNKDMFPFFNLDNNKLKTLFQHKISKKLTQNQNPVRKNNIKTSICSVCDKQNKIISKSVPCYNCFSPIHKKCSQLKATEVLDLFKRKTEWECPFCMQQKFPFHLVNDKVLVKESFNSNFNCKCKTTSDYCLGNSKYIFKYKKDCTNKDTSFANTVDINDQILNDFTINPNFKYYQNHEFHKLTKNLNSQNNFSVFHTNICSLQGNFDNLQILTTNLDFKFDVIAVSETWTPESRNNTWKPDTLEGYQNFCGVKGKTLKSGCGFFIKNEIKYKIRNDLNISFADDENEFQFFWIEIINDKNPNIILGVCYRHPKKNSNNIFIEKLKIILQRIKNNNKIVVITGDFNYDILKYEHNNIINDFINLMYSHFLHPCILEPTRIVSHNRPSLLDNIFINIHNKIIHSGNLLDKISDHMPNFLIIENILEPKIHQKIKIRDMKNFNEDKYLDDLDELKQTNFLQFENVNDMYKAFQDKYLEIINNNAPFKILSKKETKQRQKPWVTKSIIQSIKIRNIYYKKYMKTQEMFWYDRYKYYKSKITMLLRKSKQNHLRKFFQENQLNSKVLWGKINELLNKKKSATNDIFLNDNETIITDQQVIANKFNKYYINVAQNLLKEMGETNNKFQDYLKNPNEHSFFLKETTPDEVGDLLKSINSKKASDLYGISPYLVKISSEKIKDQLALIFNASFEQGIVPEHLKCGLIHPIHKGDSKFLCSNYRPISILPIFSKILEKLMHKRLTSFLEKFELLYNHQFGFQKGKSTEHAILDLNFNIIKALEKKEKACTIFLDFAKAFDTVNHKILLSKLEHFGIRGIPLNWFRSYLANRQQCVKIGQQISDYETVKCGVPQGSVLGPLLFLIYINDIAFSNKKVSFHLFADDTCLFYSHKSYNQLEADLNTALDNIANWLKANKLTLNVKKSNLILYDARKNLKYNPNVKICIENNELEQKDSAKYLGVYFDKRLSWDVQLNYTNAKLSRGIGILKKLRKYVQENILKNLFNSFIKPYIEYGTLAWGAATNNHLGKINLSIKRSIRTILFKDKLDSVKLCYESVKPYYEYLNILPLLDNIKLLQGKFMWNLINDNLPKPLIEHFPLKYNEAINNQQKRLIIPYHRTAIGKRSLSYSGHVLWNQDIPENIKNKKSDKSFVKAYKQYLLNKNNT